jgi:hypothetical protein
LNSAVPAGWLSNFDIASASIMVGYIGLLCLGVLMVFDARLTATRVSQELTDRFRREEKSLSVSSIRLFGAAVVCASLAVLLLLVRADALVPFAFLGACGCIAITFVRARLGPTQERRFALVRPMPITALLAGSLLAIMAIGIQLVVHVRRF